MGSVPATPTTNIKWFAHEAKDISTYDVHTYSTLNVFFLLLFASLSLSLIILALVRQLGVIICAFAVNTSDSFFSLRRSLYLYIFGNDGIRHRHNMCAFVRSPARTHIPKSSFFVSFSFLIPIASSYTCMICGCERVYVYVPSLL